MELIKPILFYDGTPVNVEEVVTDSLKLETNRVVAEHSNEMFPTLAASFVKIGGKNLK